MKKVRIVISEAYMPETKTIMVSAPPDLDPTETRQIEITFEVEYPGGMPGGEMPISDPIAGRAEKFSGVGEVKGVHGAILNFLSAIWEDTKEPIPLDMAHIEEWEEQAREELEEEVEEFEASSGEEEEWEDMAGEWEWGEDIKKIANVVTEDIEINNGLVF